MRTPLNIILGYTGLIGEVLRDRGDEIEQGYYESVHRGAQRLQRTVDMILSISRLQVGDIRLEERPLELPQLLQNIVDDYRPLAEESGLSLAFEREVGDVTVVADEYCLLQTMQNLLDNAVKYTQQGGVTVHLSRDGDGTVRIAVRDTGIGISEEYLPQLFEPYTQEESGYSRSFEGIGLGMSLVKKYTELLHATLDIQSVKNEGTTVSLLFAAPSGADAGGDALSTDTGDDDEPVLPAILLVEDERLTVEYMSTLLRNHARIHTAESGTEAWEVLRSKHIDLVFMDISLAGEKSGLDITREIRADAELSALPVVAVTAHGFAHDRTRCLQAGCDAYLLKPVGQDDLLTTIADLLHKRK